MPTLTVEVNINGHKEIVPRAVTVQMDEIAGMPATQACRYIDEQVERWVAEAVKVTWTVERSRAATKEREQIAA